MCACCRRRSSANLFFAMHRSQLADLQVGRVTPNASTRGGQRTVCPTLVETFLEVIRMDMLHLGSSDVARALPPHLQGEGAPFRRSLCSLARSVLGWSLIGDSLQRTKNDARPSIIVRPYCLPTHEPAIWRYGLRRHDSSFPTRRAFPLPLDCPPCSQSGVLPPQSKNQPSRFRGTIREP